MKKSVLWLGLFWIIIAGCKEEQTQTASLDYIKVEVTQVLHDYYAAIRKSGLTAEFEYLDSSDQFFWVPPGFDTPLSYDTVAAIITRNAGKYQSVDNEWELLQVTPINVDLAIYTGRLKSEMTDTMGTKSAFRLVETGVVIKREDVWKLLGGQTTILH